MNSWNLVSRNSRREWPLARDLIGYIGGSARNIFGYRLWDQRVPSRGPSDELLIPRALFYGSLAQQLHARYPMSVSSTIGSKPKLNQMGQTNNSYPRDPKP